MVTLAHKITSSKQFQTLVLLLIVASGLLSGIESYYVRGERSPMLGYLETAQAVILWCFVVEIGLKILACGARPWRYFANGWNLFDFAIVAICLLPFQAQFGTVFRMARLLRTLRLVTVLPRLQLLVTTLLKSIPSLGYIGILLGLHFYMYAVIGTFVFGGNDPMRFGNLHKSFVSLFQVLTLEGWNDVLSTQQLGSDAAYDEAWKVIAGTARTSIAQPVTATIYFISFILLGTMIMLNLFTGVIIASMEEASNEVADEKRQKALEETGVFTVEDELTHVGRRLREMAGRLDAMSREKQGKDRHTVEV